MPGSFGTSPNGDGAVASTKSSDRSGLFASNEGSQPPTPGKPGGNGVFGLSTVPNASGVFGVNDGPDGCGVAGASQRGDGMRATTHSAARSGIFAQNTSRDASPEGTPGGNGVFGLSLVPNASGVFGAHNNAGTGVCGLSRDGIGVWGIGGRLAAKFDGNVEVNGTLSVNGQPITDTLRQLFDMIAGLEGQVSRLQSDVGGLQGQLAVLQGQVATLGR